MPSTLTRASASKRCFHRLNGPCHALRRTAFVNNWYLVRAALRLAIELHHGQRREAGGPYIYHPIRVTLKLWTLGIREEYVLAAALLHDVLEDCEERLDKKILGRFYALNPRTVAIVQVLTKGTPHNADQYFGRISTGSEASLIKLADRADNLVTMNAAYSPDRARKYIEETKLYITPLAEASTRANLLRQSAFAALRSEIKLLLHQATRNQAVDMKPVTFAHL